MRVKILEAFTVDTATGPVRHEVDDIVGNGQRNWVDKGLAVETTDEKPKPDEESAETPKG